MRKALLLVIAAAGLMAADMNDGIEERVVNNFTAYVNNFPHEKIYLHTDKSVYVAGENVWFRAYGVHDLLNVPGIPSRFVYVDLVDKRDELVGRVKLATVDSCFYGQLPLPEELTQGEYCLRAYTLNLANQGTERAFVKKIRVVNPQDSKVKTEVTYRREGRQYVATVAFKDGKGEPYARTRVKCVTDPGGNALAGQWRVTDDEGRIEVRVDSTNSVLRVEFDEEKAFDFERDLYLPDLRTDFDAQFFPEGGRLLAGNRQQVAFKAVGADGWPVEVSGEVYQGMTRMLEFRSEHDGMGSFLLPVNAGYKYWARVRTADGREKLVDLPAGDETGWGVAVETDGGAVEYTVMRGERAETEEEMYAVVHSRGLVFDVRRVDGPTRGRIDASLLPEGISQVLLMDGEGRVHSQRRFFVRRASGNGAEARSDKSSYTARERVTLSLGLAGEVASAGSFSLSVTDDGQVWQDPMEDNIVSNLLMTSYLRGYIKDPGYYFSDTTEEVARHLDLVMQTHGWTRFDPEKIARGEFPKERYEIELGQVISGQVTNFWGKESGGAEIVLLSNYGDYRMTETDTAGRFEVDDLVFRDSTLFFVQALKAGKERSGKKGMKAIAGRGRRNVEVAVDPERFLEPFYQLPNTMETKEEEDGVMDRFSRDYYYVDGQRVYILEEVEVKRSKVKKSYSFYDHLALYQADSAKLADLPDGDFFQLVTWAIPGVTEKVGEDGELTLQYRGKDLYVLLNDLEEEMVFVRALRKEQVTSISLLEPLKGQLFFGEKGKDGVLLVTTNTNFIPPTPRQRPNVLPIRLLGYQIPEAFYVPRYDVDSVRRDNRYDERTTIYWNPVVKLEPGRETEVSFYTADMPGTYTVVLEGVTRDGQVLRKRTRLTVE